MGFRFLQLIRFQNLGIVALTQFLLQYIVLIPAFRNEGLSPALDHLHFALLVFTTMIIAASGYVINDLKDIEIDRINKPDKMILGNIWTEKSGWQLYWAMNILGVAIATYLAIHVNNFPLVLLFPLAVGSLYLYSARLKKSFLLGNLLVALFCAFVAGIVWFAERNIYAACSEATAFNIRLIFIAYLIFAGISTLYREIIKDMEDIDGDRKLGGKTLPIQLGIPAAKQVAGSIGLLLLGLVIFWMTTLVGAELQLFLILYVLGGICIPLIISLILLYKADHSASFALLSKMAKYIMFSGILYLALYGIIS